MKLDERKTKILGAVVDAYIVSGEPVGSKAVANMLDVSVSSATIRNDMASLEKMGFLEQPHTSAGRVPTYRGYRFYIEKLMRPKTLSAKEKQLIDNMLKKEDFTANAVIENAIEALAEVTGYAAVNAVNAPKFTVISKVEVIPAGKRLYALLIITSSGEIKNKVCRVEMDLTDEQIGFFGKIVNESLRGKSATNLNPAVMQNLAVALGSYMMGLSPLLYAVFELSQQLNDNSIHIHKEERLLSYRDVDPKEIAAFFSKKDELVSVLEKSFSGIHVVFGKENDNFAITNSSLITSSFGEKDGSFGVIGPIRLDYKKIIPYVQYFAESITNILKDIDQADRKEDSTDE